MWYRKANIKGEYWLTENGPEFADGNTSDNNHEMIAESHMLGQLGNDIEDDWGVQTYYNAKNMFWNALHDGMYLGSMEDYMEQLQATYGDEYLDYADFDSYLIWLNTWQHQDEAVKKVQKEWAEREIAGMKDPRLHVSQHYDWVKVQGNEIQVWEMNDQTRARIKSQIEQIIDEEALDSYDENWKDAPIFNLPLIQPVNIFRGLPIMI